MTLLLTAALSACGGGGGGGSSGGDAAPSALSVSSAGATIAAEARTAQAAAVLPGEASSQRDAVRLADQGTFGPTEALVAQLRAQGVRGFLNTQFAMSNSRFTSGGTNAVHKNTSSTQFCDQPAQAGGNCWRDWQSSQPLVWDFYRNAVTQPDQLRQRVAYALTQIVVVSGREIEGTYGLRNYHNALLDNAFGNYRQVLKNVALSPVMGDYLNNVNNDKSAPNENFARELLQLFAVGTCELNIDGTLKGGACSPTYNNEMVRSYAFALTGWTYPAGGATPWGCWPSGANCQYYDGDMVPVSAFHDSAARTLMGGVSLAANHTAPVALDRVLDSLMAHPNMAPFISKQLIQHLVSSNPSPAYVARVAAAFNSGVSGAHGSGQRGDLKATIAAILMDGEARVDPTNRTSLAGQLPSVGRLREPALMFTGVLRALNGSTDGDAFGFWWGEEMRQHAFRAPSVFNFYPPDYPVPGTALVGPAFGIHNANSALQRLNFLTFMVDWGGLNVDASVPNAMGSHVDLTAFKSDAADAAALVDRLSMLALGKTLSPAPRTDVINAVAWWTSARDANNWQMNRVKAAAYLVFASPDYQVQR